MSAAVMMYYRSNGVIRILSGIESYYCFETPTSVEEQEQLLDWERPSSREEAAERAMVLAQHYGTHIQYSPPDASKRIHYCCVTQKSKMGVIKGSIEDGEEPLATIQREMQEEIGLMVPSHRLIPSGFRIPRMTTFWMPISQKEVNWIELRINERREQLIGEVFDVAFRTVDEIKSSGFALNSVTRFLLSHLPNRLPFPLKEFDLRPTSPRRSRTYPIQPVRPLFDPWEWGTQRSSLFPIRSRSRLGVETQETNHCRLMINV